jgi:hypothetical protein
VPDRNVDRVEKQFIWRFAVIDTTLFKAMALEMLPQALFTSLEPHIEKILTACDEVEFMEEHAREMEFLKQEYAWRRFDEIRAEFHAQNEPSWPAFARARWPEIDKYFNLEATPARFDDIPF